MKICFVSHSPAKGGAERALLELLEALKDNEVECYVLLPSDGPLVEELKKLRIDFCILPYRWWMGKNSPLWKRIGRIGLNLAVAIPAAVKVKRWKCDIIYTNTITVCVGAFVAFLLRKPHVWHIHEFGQEDHHLVFDLGQKFSLWLIGRLSSVCVANSNAVAQKYIQHIPSHKVKVVYQSVSITRQALSSQADFLKQTEKEAGIRCVIVGALQDGKGQEDAIRAIGELVHRGIKVQLIVVGDGELKYREYLRELVVENGLDKYVTFVGYVDNPFPFMQSADVLLMCSRYEAFGRVTVEAMQVGKPVIGARSGGTTELVLDGFNGLLYSPGDYKELAEKIYYLYEHPSDAQKMGENAKQWAEQQFTKDRYGEEMLAILRQLVNYAS